MNKKIIIILVLLVIGIGFIALNTKDQLAGLPGKMITSVSTSTSVSVSTTSATMLATNSNRNSAVLVNDGSNIVYLSLGTTAVANQGIRLNASGGSYEINTENLYVGVINGITSSGTSTLTLIEF